MTNAVADFAFMRQWRSYADGQLPALIGALYKITLGVTSTSFAAWADGTVTFKTPTDSRFLFDYAERFGQLVGPEQVCGGTESMIIQLLDVVLHGGDERAGGPETAEVIADVEKFRRFCDATAALRLLRAAFERIDALLRWELGALLPELGDIARHAFVGDLVPGSWLVKFVQLDRGEREAQLQDLLSTMVDARYSPAPEFAAGAPILLASVEQERDGCLPVVARLIAEATAGCFSSAACATLTRIVARYLEIERIAAMLARSLKVRIADTLKIDLAQPMARELGLINFVPLRPTRPSMRSALRKVFAIDVSGLTGDVTIAHDVRRVVLEPEVV